MHEFSMSKLWFAKKNQTTESSLSRGIKLSCIELCILKGRKKHNIEKESNIINTLGIIRPSHLYLFIFLKNFKLPPQKRYYTTSASCLLNSGLNKGDELRPGPPEYSRRNLFSEREMSGQELCPSKNHGYLCVLERGSAYTHTLQFFTIRIIFPPLKTAESKHWKG